MVDRTRTSESTFGLTGEVARLQARLLAEGVSAAQVERTAAILSRFVRFGSAGHGLESLAEVGPTITEAFIRAPLECGQSPSVSTLHWRRTALRLLFRAARAEGLASTDPTLDVALPPRCGAALRPLTDDEVALCRSVAHWSLSGSRRAAAWALAEATARSSELPLVTANDIDFEAGRVWLPGGRATNARWAGLTDWGTARLLERVAEVTDPELPLVYAGDGPTGAGRVAGSIALTDVLTRAGLQSEPNVRPGSVAAWAGSRVLEKTGRIDSAARALGVRSLDQAARIVGWDWHEIPEPAE